MQLNALVALTQAGKLVGEFSTSRSELIGIAKKAQASGELNGVEVRELTVLSTGFFPKSLKVAAVAQVKPAKPKKGK